MVPRFVDKNVIGTKWVFINKLNEDGEVVTNKSRLVCTGDSQVEGIDFEETFVMVMRMKEIKMFHVFTIHKDFKVYQMDVIFDFLNGDLEEEVYIDQSNGFQL